MVNVRENDFMREERRPLKGVGTVGLGAADKFMLSVRLAYQFGVAKLADDLVAVALREEVFQFHTQPLYGRGLDNGCPCEKSAPGARKSDGCAGLYAGRIDLEGHRRKFEKPDGQLAG